MSSATPLSAMLWVLGGGIIGSFGAVGLKAGANRLQLTPAAILRNWRLLGGIFAYLLSSLLYMKGMAQGQLSVLYPLVAIANIWNLMWGRFLFHEAITRTKLLALALIILGVILIKLGS
jgi:multidrug transporter EmrE-like cation transporter